MQIKTIPNYQTNETIGTILLNPTVQNRLIDGPGAYRPPYKIFQQGYMGLSVPSHARKAIQND